MNKIHKLFLILTVVVLVTSCAKDDSPNVAPLRDYAEQYATDNTDIEEYLKTHYVVEVVNNPGQTNDKDVVIEEIPTGGTQTAIWDMPNLEKNFTVDQNDITYKVYFLRLGDEGVGESPCNVDNVLTSYVGSYLKRETETIDGVEVSKLKTTEFETLLYPQSMFNLEAVIKGWSEVFPKFKTGTYSDNVDGTVSYNGFGAGVMFLPSGLAYYGAGGGSIPAYSPLIFSFKLYAIKRMDQDGDGIMSYQEDLNGDGYVRRLGEGVINPDDTDGDEAPNYLDVDDDGDHYLTKNETKRPNIIVNGVSVSNGYYPYNGALLDDPLTPNIDETQGIPACGDTDFTSPARLRKHLDASPNCH